jgi:prepilin peptidase CpaA
VIGGALTLGILSLRKTALPGVLMSQGWIARLHQQGNGVPYGIALAVAGLSIYPETTLWHAVVAA